MQPVLHTWICSSSAGRCVDKSSQETNSLAPAGHHHHVMVVAAVAEVSEERPGSCAGSGSNRHPGIRQAVRQSGVQVGRQTNTCYRQHVQTCCCVSRIHWGVFQGCNCRQQCTSNPRSHQPQRYTGNQTGRTVRVKQGTLQQAQAGTWLCCSAYTCVSPCQDHCAVVHVLGTELNTHLWA